MELKSSHKQSKFPPKPISKPTPTPVSAKTRVINQRKTLQNVECDEELQKIGFKLGKDLEVQKLKHEKQIISPGKIPFKRLRKNRDVQDDSEESSSPE